MDLKEIFSFSAEETASRAIKNNLENIKLFFIVFAVNIIIFGQKIFFSSLSTDDYERYYMHNDIMELTAKSGRWAYDLLSIYIFHHGLHVLPYFHGIIGVLSFTLLGFLTAKYFKQNNALVIFITTLLISATPMIARNLYFNTNIVMWITTLLGVIGFLWAHKPNIFIKFIGFILLVIAIGTYQTIIQILLAMIIFKAMMELLEVKNSNEIKNILLSSFGFVLFILLAYVVSIAINELFIHYYHLSKGDRYNITGNISGLSIYLDRIVKMYYSYVRLSCFKIQFHTLYIAMAFLSVIGIIFTVLKRNVNKSIKLVSLFLIILLLLSIPIIINLPLITGNTIPARAHFTIGWVLAGFFTMQAVLFKGVSKTLSYITAISIIIVSTYYIIIFFDAASRQTSSDITRVNQIVNRIRVDKNYISEPLKFKIVGTKSFPVTGWQSNQQALKTDRAKYGAFKNFTDLKFTKMNDGEYDEIVDLIAEKDEKINSYPAKNSIFVYGNKAVLFLDSRMINARVAINNIQKREPNIKAEFDLYLDKNKLIYYKSPCAQKDTAHIFFLHIYPDDSSILSKGSVFKNMDFEFNGIMENNQCIVIKDLPNFKIKKINTGQYSTAKDKNQKLKFTFHWNTAIDVK